VRWLSRGVTFVLITILVVAIVLFVRSRMPETKVGQAFTTCAAFRDGSKLSPGSPVLIAGVRVGEITNLSIVNDYARIDMTLRNDTKVPSDSWVTKRAFSPFGDSYIEILPSGGEEGAANVQMLKTGECLMHVAEGASTDRLLRVMTRSMPQLEDGLERLDEVSTYGRKWAAGTLEDNALDAEKWLQEGHIEGPLEKADKALARLETATVGAAASVHAATPNVLRTIERIQSGIVTARKKMAGVEVDLHEGFQRARDGLNDVDQTVADINEYVAAVNEGSGSGTKGQLGKLVNDPTLYNDIEEATASARDGVASFGQFKSWLGLRAEYNFLSHKPRFFVTAEIRAHSDKFYLVELERGPLGDVPDDSISDAVGVPTYQRHQVIKDGVRFTAQFGKSLTNWFRIRGGIKESTFGFGSDILLNRGRLRFSGDLYGGVFRTPRVKVAGALEVFRSFFIVAGVDDALNDEYNLRIRKGNSDVPHAYDEVRFGRDYFLGGTLQFTDADLAVLIRVYGALLVGLL